MGLMPKDIKDTKTQRNNFMDQITANLDVEDMSPPLFV